MSRKEDDKKILSESISSLFAKDPWIRSFMQEVYDLFGIPKSTEYCMCKTDKLLFVWAMMNLVKAMNSDNSWIQMRENVNPEDAAYDFIKGHFEKTGELLLENVITEELVN